MNYIEPTNNGSNFRILGIRAFEGTPKNILKALDIDVLYSFYSELQFLGENEKAVQGDVSVQRIILDTNVPDNLYSKNSPTISVAAVIGKNGDGKSSLNELLYFFNFLISTTSQVKFITDVDDLTSSYFPAETGSLILITFYESILKSKVEVFYTSDGDIFRLFYTQNTVVKQQMKKKGGWKEILPHSMDEDPKASGILTFKPSFLSDFGYTVAINYSLYGLNGNGDYWLNSLFHKNDGYQTPIVINPYRESGQVDVNRELHLSQSRTLSNLSGKSEDFPEVINQKKLEAIQLLIIPEDFDNVHMHPMSNLIKWHEEKHKQSIYSFFNKIGKAFTGKTILTKKEISELKRIEAIVEVESLIEKFKPNKYPEPLPDNLILYYFVKYVVRKVFKICKWQSGYKEYFVDKTGVYDYLPPFKLKDITLLLKTLVEDESHVTIKLRQAIWAIKQRCFFENWERIENPKNPNHIALTTKISFANYKSCVQYAIEKNKELSGDRILEAVPNAMYLPKMLVRRTGSVSSKFQHLSSGEQQFVNSYQTAIYHLRNLESVHSSNDVKKVAYENVTIIFDEIELYFHPEFQRKFLEYLLNEIELLQLQKIKGIHIIFSTHSPFILSDIPKQNVLQMKEGKPVIDKTLETFGANIHTILSKGFFLDAQIGAVAREIIQEVIQKLNELRVIKSNKGNEQILNTEDQEFLAQKIKLIGDPLVREKLREIYLEIFDDESFVLNEMEYLQSQLNKLQNRTRNDID